MFHHSLTVMLRIFYFFSLISLCITSHVYLLSDPEMEKISTLLDLAVEGKYPGTNTTRHGKHGVVPIWNQRTSILYYNRNYVGKPVMWLTLSMGVVGNANGLFSNKRTWLSYWRKASPDGFRDVDAYIPKTWSDIDSFERDMDPRAIYVYKPVHGYQGRGIAFKKGSDIHKYTRVNGNWIVQEFINSFLYRGKKNHIRVITLFIVQPDGSRQFFIYKRMRLYTSPEKFDEHRLLSGEDVHYMLLTNLHQNEAYFREDKNNNGKKFSSRDCLFDVHDALRGDDSGISFDHVMKESIKMHSAIYSTIGNIIECKPTDVSIYNESCFHLVASDLSFDTSGKPTLLEMNHRMGLNILWTPEEQEEMGNGVASLVRGVVSPYKIGETTMWDTIPVSGVNIH